jgi:hypothetical protein
MLEINLFPRLTFLKCYALMYYDRDHDSLTLREEIEAGGSQCHAKDTSILSQEMGSNKGLEKFT